MHRSASSQSRNQQLALKDHLLRQVASEPEKKLFLPGDFHLEFLEVDVLERVEVLCGDIQAFEVDVGGARHPAEDGFLGVSGAARTFYDPLEHAHVLAEAGPEVSAVLVL